MFNGKSPATFFVKLFDKEKDANDNNTSKEDLDENIEDFGGRPNGVEGRKRSQSMFAPNVTSLLAGNHFGGKGDIIYSSKSDTIDSVVQLSVPYIV